MGSTNTDKNTNTNADIIVGSQAIAAKMQGIVVSGTNDGDVRITLPKGTYSVDGDGNLIIHGGGFLSGGEPKDAQPPLCPDISYEEFMAKPDNRDADSHGADRSVGGDPFGMDFSALGADPKKLVGECRGTVYGYARCSTVHQDYQRQIDAFRELGIREENIFREKKSGKDFSDRDEFRKMMGVIRPGDCIVVLELDRFGRDMFEIKKHWFWITQHRQADIIVLDQSILNTRIGAQGIAGFIADLILAVFSLMAEIERKLIRKRMDDGIRLARLMGKKMGRKLKEIPMRFWKIRDLFLGGKISQNKASQNLGVDPKTFQSWVKRTVDILDAQEWETLKPCIEEQEKEERIRQAKIEYGVMAESDAEMEQAAEVTQETAAEQKEEVARKMDAKREEEAVQEAMGQKEEVAQDVAAEQKMEKVREINAGRNGAATGQEIPAESDRTDADGRDGYVRQTVEESHGAEEAGHGVAGNPARADGRAVEKAGRRHRKSKFRRSPGEVKKKPAQGRKARRNNRRK